MRTWLEISRRNLIHNAAVTRRFLAPRTMVLAVVKSNAYGHGIKQVVSVLKSKVDWFGVANLEEALELSEITSKKPILILSSYEFSSVACRKAVLLGVRFPLYTIPQAKFLHKLGTRIKQKIPIHLKIDTGTSRIGLLPKDFMSFYKAVSRLKGLKIEGLYSHFADSEGDVNYTKMQISRFSAISRSLRQEYPNLICHIACSASLARYPNAHFDMVRAGIMLYGLSSSKQLLKSGLRPVLEWKTKIIDIKSLPANTPVGYGLTYRTKRPLNLAVLPIGYADGYDRLLSNRGEVLISGKFAPIIGRICMNLSMVDVSKIQARLGDEVVLIGRQGLKKIGAIDVADASSTIHYETVTRINWTLPRILV